MSGLLSDGVAAYGKLLRLIRNIAKGRRRMVVSNSWGMFSPDWDFPVGHPGNYSDNPAHPFNVIVAALERQGADILFAAGNCGQSPCIDWRCGFGPTQRAICGANSHPKVLSIAGIDTRKRHIGYSSEGPGRLAAQKPDVSAYTEFTGSMVYGSADGGTSAACPVAAGVVAAVRSKYSAAKVSPAKLRALVQKTAEDLGGSGYDHTFGWGAIDPRPLVEALAKA
jgi:subtilisin family serine protease